MIGNIAWWDLGASEATIDSLQRYLRDEGAALWSGMAGLRLKFWIADRENDRWGAVMVWAEGADPQELPLPPNRAIELIGYPPTQRMNFEIEAAVEGAAPLTAFDGTGAAFAALAS